MNEEVLGLDHPPAQSIVLHLVLSEVSLGLRGVANVATPNATTAALTAATESFATFAFNRVHRCASVMITALPA